MSEMPSLPRMPEMPNPLRILVRKASDLPEPDLVSYYALEAERKLYIDQEIDESILTVQRMILRWNMEDAGLPAEERKPIRLLIHSPGGSVAYMWGLIDTIEASKTPVETVNMGLAASAAAIIFLSGHKRRMMPRSRMLIHEGSARMAGDSTKVLDASDSYRRNIKQMRDYILERTEIPAATLARQRSHDWELDAETCLKYKACDEVVRDLETLM